MDCILSRGFDGPYIPLIYMANHNIVYKSFLMLQDAEFAIERLYIQRDRKIQEVVVKNKESIYIYILLDQR